MLQILWISRGADRDILLFLGPGLPRTFITEDGS